ncbi:hypothetical protein NC653_015280 [Populus alba x Populus x berolinensis]|uniref:Uncharacterized protein n=1 Tax=Populus alba x Populus x berolinensis TaxID=444605 RepID=A0AAD6QK55_9ROSI|nr:hypothetical protein NC653_015280 [Populus alba x Populus x berolinensis]
MMCINCRWATLIQLIDMKVSVFVGPIWDPQMLLSGTKYVQAVELSFYQWRCPSVIKRGDNNVEGFSFRWHFSGLPLIKYFWNGLWENILRS